MALLVANLWNVNVSGRDPGNKTPDCMDTLWNSLPKGHGHRRWFPSWRNVAKYVTNAFHLGADRAPATQPTAASGHLSSCPEPAGLSTSSGLRGKRVAMVTF